MTGLERYAGTPVNLELPEIEIRASRRTVADEFSGVDTKISDSV
jgi:hypothetical protein